MNYVFWRRAQFFLLTATATYLSLVPKPGAVFEQSPDKFLHVLCWGALLLSLRLATGSDRWHWQAPLFLFAYSILVEMGQALVPNRFFSGADILANGAGILIGCGLVAAYERWLKPTVTTALRRR